MDERLKLPSGASTLETPRPLNQKPWYDVSRRVQAVRNRSPAANRNSLDSSSGWETEHTTRFTPRNSLPEDDWARRYKPHVALAEHIQQLHGKKPVCTVKTLLKNPPESRKTEPSYYSIAYPQRKPAHPRVVVRAQKYAKRADGILPLNVNGRPETLFPVCDLFQIPSQQKYFTRRREIPSPYEDEGVFYSDAPTRMEGLHKGASTSRISPKGTILNRRRYLKPPQTILEVKNFDGGAPASDDPPFYMRFVKSKTII